MIKCYTIFIILLLNSTNIYAQDDIDHPFHNNVVFCFDGGITLPQTDYLKNKVGFGFRGSGEYYFTTNSVHLIGMKLKLGSEQIKGEDDRGTISTQDGDRPIPPAFTTDLYSIGFEAIYGISISNVVIPYLSGGISNLWYYPMDDQGNPAEGGKNKLYEKTTIAYSLELGFKFLVSDKFGINLSFNQRFPQSDYIDDLAAAVANDAYSSVMLGISFSPFYTPDTGVEDITISNELVPEETKETKATEEEVIIPEEEKSINEQRIVIGGDDIFDPNSAMIKVEGKKQLDDVILKLKKFPGNRWRIEGHMDSSGSKRFLRNLSLERAKAVQEYFSYFGGLDKDNFEVVGLGDDFPIDNNYSEEGRKNNRRIEILPEIIDEPAIIPDEKAEEFSQFILRVDDSFEPNSSRLTLLGKLLLDEIALYIKARPESYWKIEAYTDNQGTASIQKRITTDWASAVYDYLISKGLSEEQFSVYGLGSSNPIAKNDTETGRSTNRRVLIIRKN